MHELLQVILLMETTQTKAQKRTWNMYWKFLQRIIIDIIMLLVTTVSECQEII